MFHLINIKNNNILGLDANNKSPEPSTVSSDTDQTKDIADDVEQPQNSTLSSDEESLVSSASKSISKTRNKRSTPSKYSNDKRNSTQNKEIPDENENCDSFVSNFHTNSKLISNNNRMHCLLCIQ